MRVKYTMHDPCTCTLAGGNETVEIDVPHGLDVRGIRIACGEDFGSTRSAHDDCPYHGWPELTGVQVSYADTLRVLCTEGYDRADIAAAWAALKPEPYLKTVRDEINRRHYEANPQNCGCGAECREGQCCED